MVAPIDLVTDAKGKPIGFTMQHIEGAEDLLRLSQRRFREGVISNGEVTTLFSVLRALVEKSPRARGVEVIGDFNDSNVVFTADRSYQQYLPPT